MRFPAAAQTALLSLAMLSLAGPSYARKKAENFNSHYNADENVEYRVDPNKPNDPNPQAPETKISPKFSTTLPNETVIWDNGMSQNDTFKTAAEQAIYLQLYQRNYGPYGLANPNRDKVLRDTAEAINDCLKGQNCDATKQERVLTALVNYNTGQILKAQVLTNNSNQQRMLSYEEPGFDIKDRQTRSSLTDSKKMWNSLESGTAMSGPRTRKRNTTISSVSSRPKYFQIDDSKLYATIDDESKLGDRYVDEHREFLREYTQNTNPAPYYKYVRAKVADSGEMDVYVPQDEKRPEYKDKSRMDEVRAEQQDRRIQEIAGKYIKDIQKPTLTKTVAADGTVILHPNGPYYPTYVGLAQPTVVLDKDKDGKDIPIAAREGFRKIGQDINKQFKKGYEEEMKRLGEAPASRQLAQNGSGSSSSAPSASPKDIANTVINATLDQGEFDKFLNDIWPSAAERKKRLQP